MLVDDAIDTLAEMIGGVDGIDEEGDAILIEPDDGDGESVGDERGGVGTSVAASEMAVEGEEATVPPQIPIPIPAATTSPPDPRTINSLSAAERDALLNALQKEKDDAEKALQQTIANLKRKLETK